MTRKHVLYEARDLRVEQTAGQSLRDPREDQHVRVGGEADDGAGQDESGRPDEQHLLAAAVIAQAAGQDRDDTERERVTRDDPLQLSRMRARALADRGQRDDDHGRIE